MKRILALLILTGALGVIPLGIFYTGQIRYAHTLTVSANLPLSYANALQHAHAAASCYMKLRYIMEPESAEGAVIFLGMLNEYFESIFKRRDSTLEMTKDLYNNQMGVSVARWREENTSAPEPAVLLVQMAREHVLVLAEQDIPITHYDPQAVDVAHAHERFRNERVRIREQTLAWLNAR